MGVQHMREWSCDNHCGRTEQHPQQENSPEGWVVMRWNKLNPLGSLDADGWEFAIVCGVCWAAVEEALDQVVNPPEKIKGES